MLFVLPIVGAVVETVAAAVSVGTAVTAGVASVGTTVGSVVAGGVMAVGVAEGTASVIGSIAAQGTNAAIHAGVREVIKSVTED